jgi:hypothetical protein
MRGSVVKIEMLPAGTGAVFPALVDADQQPPNRDKAVGVVTDLAHP